jgi:threonine synthase
VVCVLTGNGLKDPDCAVQNSGNQVKAGLKPDLEIVAKAMGF